MFADSASQNRQKDASNSMVKGQRMQRIIQNPILNLAAHLQNQDQFSYNKILALECQDELQKRFISVNINNNVQVLQNPRKQTDKKQKIEVDITELLLTILLGGNASLEQEFSLFKFIQEGRRNRLTTENLKNRIFAKFEKKVRNFININC
eukprot:TRINITY_DN16539_c0_g1_i1.p2 TRINITY_DN16539_c0_g1~~TRINITY_DN16539_c0_g1_i1.p2  ORF type:complete len:159 (+),score=3.99 TRINITY_DN16539_c0_g1_i1:27-479(+)